MHLPQPQGITLSRSVLGKVITTLSLYDFDVEGGEKEHVINDLKSVSPGSGGQPPAPGLLFDRRKVFLSPLRNYFHRIKCRDIAVSTV